MSSFFASWKALATGVVAAIAVILALILHGGSPPPPGPSPVATWTWPSGTRTPVPMKTPGIIVVHATPYACLKTDDAPGQSSDEPPGQDFDAHNCPGVS